MMIRDLLAGKSSQERAVIKSVEIAKLNHVGIFDSPEHGLQREILSLNEIVGGIEIFARAWKNGKPLGFGGDGTTEIERFKIINPPILVPDPNGFVVSEWTDKTTGELKRRIVREDPIEAIRQSLAETIKLVGKENSQIIKGSIGSTTTTVYPTIDGSLYLDGHMTWAQLRDGANASSVIDTTNPDIIASIARDDSGHPTNWWSTRRGVFSYNTSGIGAGQTVSSATHSIYGTAKNVGALTYTALCLIPFAPATDGALVVGDFDSRTYTKLATDIAYADYSTTAYNDQTLNAAGISNINVTGYSHFMFVLEKDFQDDGTLEGNYDQNHTYSGNFSEQAGTTNDPKLVVVHASPPYQPRHGFVFHNNPGII